MKIKVIIRLLIVVSASVQAQHPESVERVGGTLTLSGKGDLHITASDNVIQEGALLNVADQDVFVFFDHVKPNDVYRTYGSRIQIQGEPMNPKRNCRIVVYRHGAVLMPYPADFKPLSTFTEKGQKGSSATYLPDIYYTNQPDEQAKEEMVRPLPHDNAIRSMVLKRGYSATFATEPDGMGYSRVFIADEEDLVIDLPEQIAAKASFIRVCKWQYPSKKGWAGSVWSSAPNGLQYVNEQCDYTNSTWFYNWGTTTRSTTNPAATDSTYNQEFVPEKWGSGEATHKLMSLVNTSHLLGYNEPDHTEQSNVSVEKAIEEWPQLLKTGLRLGSPATTNFSWLYEFMSQCNRKNYRVDYVVIHAYWGGLSPDEWYKKLKDVYDHTKRPLWIKEWNNGANWTKEGWPSGTTEQQQKQLRDLKGILQVMDTCSFVERYSIYNWVEDKRAIILNGKLTPAGEYYAADQPSYFFNKSHEVVPVWSVREAPVLSYSGFDESAGACFSWTDINREMVPWYIVEKSLDGKQYQVVDSVASNCPLQYTDLLEDGGTTGRAFYRVRSVADEGGDKTSNTVCVNYLRNQPDDWLYAHDVIVNEQWTIARLTTPVEQPFVVLGVPTYRNKVPLSYRLGAISGHHVDLQLPPWEYQQHPSYVNPDTVGVMVVSQVKKNDFPGEMLLADASEEWSSVTFSSPFQQTPVVLPSLICEGTWQGASVRVRNVSSEGFEIRLQHEEAYPLTGVSAKVSILAMEPGDYETGSWKMKCGLTPEGAVVSNTNGGFRVDLGEAMADASVFAAMQSVNDEVCAVLRIKSRDTDSFTLIKDREKSASYTNVRGEQAGWLAVIHKPVEKGDVNADGLVDINDVVCVVNHMAGNQLWMLSDVNADGAVNINDVVAIISQMAEN